jgi:hypothetical protein
VTVNEFGFQVGLVPTDADQLARYFADSGRPDLATQLQESEAELHDLNAKIVRLETSFAFSRYPLQSAKDSADQASSEIQDIIRTYNLGLLTELQVGNDEAMASPTRGLPVALDQSVVQTGVNADFGDWVWDRTIFRWHSELSYYPMYWVGGQGADAGQLEDYMRSDAHPELASKFAVGNALSFSSNYFIEPSGAVIWGIGMLGAAGNLLGTNNNLFVECVEIAGGGIAIWVIGQILDGIGFHESRKAVSTFNGLMQEKLGLRLESLPLGP